MNRKLALLLSISLLWALSADIFGQGNALNKGQYIKNFIPMRERVQIEQKFWQWKRENVLPEIMREQDVDLWIIRNDEEPLYRMASYREHPVFTSLQPAKPPKTRVSSVPDLAFIHHRDSSDGSPKMASCFPVVPMLPDFRPDAATSSTPSSVISIHYTIIRCMLTNRTPG